MNTKKIIAFAIAFVLIISMASSVFAATYTITFNTEGGTPSTVDPQITDENGNLSLPENPTKEGYDFGGWWYRDESMPWVDKVFIESPNMPVNHFPTTEVELHAQWVSTVDTININIDLPVGTEVSSGSLQESAVTVPSGANYGIEEVVGLTTGYDSDTPFEGTIEEGKDYYVELGISPINAVFNENVAIKVNGNTDCYKVYDNYAGTTTVLNEDATKYGFYLRVKATAGAASDSGDSSSTESGYKVLEGENQTVARNSEAAFRFNIDYNKFQESGKVYVDGKEVSNKDYTSKEGSTIITLNKSFTKSLKVGKHTLKVAVADGEASTDFTISKNPATGDNIAIYASMALVSIVGLGGIVAYKKLR